MRKEADEIILGIWNEVENYFADIEEELRRKEAEKYGLVYVFRKSELEKIEMGPPTDISRENIA